MKKRNRCERNARKALKLVQKALRKAERISQGCHEDVLSIMTALRGPDGPESGDTYVLKQAFTYPVRRACGESEWGSYKTVVSATIGDVVHAIRMNAAEDEDRSGRATTMFDKDHYLRHVVLALRVICAAGIEKV